MDVSVSVQLLIIVAQALLLFFVGGVVGGKYSWRNVSSEYSVLLSPLYLLAAALTREGLFVPFLLFIFVGRVATYTLRWAVARMRANNGASFCATIIAGDWYALHRSVEDDVPLPHSEEGFFPVIRWRLVGLEAVILACQLLTYPLFLWVWANP